MTGYYDVLACAAGRVLVAVEESGSVTDIRFLADKSMVPQPGEPARTARVRKQLEEYFAGTRQDFDLPLAPGGTPFQREVWRELARIPYGETRSYGRIAAALGRPGAARAVGRAVGANRLQVVIPCHRVIGADGGLTGFAGGLAAKQFLLELERQSHRSDPLTRNGEEKSQCVV